MPKLTELTKEEFNAPTTTRKAATKRSSKRERLRARYRKYLEPYMNGGYVDVTLIGGEKRQTVKNRLMRAAEELGLTLKFKRSKGKLRFEVKPK